MDELENKGGLTQKDIDLQEASELGKFLGETALPPELLEAIALDMKDMEKNGHLRRVPEYLFIRDILPAVSGKLGEVNMRWWIEQFGSTTHGFVVTAHPQVGSPIDLFEFPAMAPSPSLEAARNAPSIGDSMANFRNRVRQRPAQAVDELKSTLRKSAATDFTDYIFNIAQVERICRRYDVSIMKESKPELVEIVDAAVQGLDEEWGTLGKFGFSNPLLKNQVSQETTQTDKASIYDDDEEASPASFD